MAKDCPHEHECFNRFDKTDKLLGEIKARLYEDKDSISMQVDRNTRFRKGMYWITGIGIVAAIRAVVQNFSGK